MNKYIYAECPSDEWPVIRTIFARSYNDAIEKLIIKYGEQYEDDVLLNTIDNFEDLQEYLNANYTLALSDLEIYEEI